MRITEVLARAERDILYIVGTAPPTEDALAKLLRLLVAEATGSARETVLDAITCRIAGIMKGNVDENGTWSP